MKNPAKKISPALFGISLICFFLPFITISCQQQPIANLTGVQLATGTDIKQPRFFGKETKEQKIPADPLALMALVSGVVGLGTSFIKAKRSAIAPAGAGAAGFILLLMLKSKIDNEIVKQGQGLILVSYGLGFWLVFLLYVSATVINIYSFVQEKDAEQ